MHAYVSQQYIIWCQVWAASLLTIFSEIFLILWFIFVLIHCDIINFWTKTWISLEGENIIIQKKKMPFLFSLKGLSTKLFFTLYCAWHRSRCPVFHRPSFSLLSKHFRGVLRCLTMWELGREQNKMEEGGGETRRRKYLPANPKIFAECPLDTFTLECTLVVCLSNTPCGFVVKVRWKQSAFWTGSVAVLHVPEVFGTWELCFIQSRGHNYFERSESLESKENRIENGVDRPACIHCVDKSLSVLFSFAFTSMPLKVIFLYIRDSSLLIKMWWDRSA